MKDNFYPGEQSIGAQVRKRRTHATRNPRSPERSIPPTPSHSEQAQQQHREGAGRASHNEAIREKSQTKGRPAREIEEAPCESNQPKTLGEQSKVLDMKPRAFGTLPAASIVHRRVELARSQSRAFKTLRALEPTAGGPVVAACFVRQDVP